MADALLQVTTNPFLAGLVSACSMPIGALLSMGWSPRHRVVASLMAFGAGALLSALVIDLVGSAQARGHLLELGMGSITGSLFYTSVNQSVNASGGFLRKPSTLLTHLKILQERQRRHRLAQLRSTELGRSLPAEDQRVLAGKLFIRRHAGGHTLFRRGDPSESVHLVLAGTVTLLDPLRDSRTYDHLHMGQCVGWLSFLTGSPHQLTAVTNGPVELAVLSRPDVEELLESSPSFVSWLGGWLRTPEVESYLQQRHGLAREQVADWIERAQASLQARRWLPDAVEVDRGRDAFLRIARRVEKFPVFSSLPQPDLEEIADRLVLGHFEDGYAFFQAGEQADRLFILREGLVELLDPRLPRQPGKVLQPPQACGELSFVTGARHTVTGVARTDVTAWVLRHADFEEMLCRSPALGRAVESFLRRARVADYLQAKQGFSPEKAGEWVDGALKGMNGSHLIPSVESVMERLERHGSAPVAIWLGLLLDGIPEALVIGAHVIVAPLSPSLLAGLFISNFPEALSSSFGMRLQGFSRPLILGLWSGLALITGVLAAIGAAIFHGVPENWVSFLEAMAAGAMLTVISETMLPESYAKGGSVVGLSTIVGFLAIIYIKSLPGG
jgi:CRP-like cAMP-binding protein/zinc transporter ZupT